MSHPSCLSQRITNPCSLPSAVLINYDVLIGFLAEHNTLLKAERLTEEPVLNLAVAAIQPSPSKKFAVTILTAAQ